MSGWATVTVDCEDESSAQAFADAIEDELLEYDEYNHVTLTDEGLRFLSWGYGSGVAGRMLREHTDKWDRAVIMECNDTSDSGSGTAYESDGSSRTTVASASGAEAARGHDAKVELQQYVDQPVYMR